MPCIQNYSNGVSGADTFASYRPSIFSKLQGLSYNCHIESSLPILWQLHSLSGSQLPSALHALCNLFLIDVIRDF